MERNLKFMLVNALMESDLIDKEALPNFNDYRDTTDDEVKEAVSFYENFELDPILLEKVETLYFDGGNDIYQEVASNYWGGEGDSFDVSDLSGIEQCKNLKTLSIISLYKGSSLRPLETLVHLEKISIDALNGCWDVDALLKLPDLKELALDWDSLTDANAEATYQQLLARGVAIQLKWNASGSDGYVLPWFSKKGT